jgi:hypothetical protein
LEELVTAFQLDRPASTDENDTAPRSARIIDGRPLGGFFSEVIENCQTEQHQRKQAKRPAGDARYFALIHVRLIRSKSDGSRAADDRPTLDMFDAVPLWLIPTLWLLATVLHRAR